jgi:type IV pilus assembly protein PilM
MSKHRLYNRFFPPPDYLSMSSMGLDVSDQSIKYAELKRKGSHIKLGRFGERRIPAGIIESGKIKDINKLVDILKELKRELSIDFVRVSLPEEQVYLFKLSIPKMDPKEVKSTIEFSLEEHIPISAAEAVFDYDLITESDTNYAIQVSALPRQVAESYLSIFNDSGLTPLSLELEAQAIVRATLREGDTGTYMIVDFGNARTGIAVVSSGAVFFTSTVDIGGATLTGMIEREFKIKHQEAEDMKQAQGLRRNSENRELFSVLLNGVSILRDEINKHYVYWHTHKDEAGEARPPIEKIILCGGDANLIGLLDYLSASMKVKVELADAWSNIPSYENELPPIPLSNSMSYITAIGLALGDFTND